MADGLSTRRENEGGVKSRRDAEKKTDEPRGAKTLDPEELSRPVGKAEESLASASVAQLETAAIRPFRD